MRRIGAARQRACHQRTVRPINISKRARAHWGRAGARPAKEACGGSEGKRFGEAFRQGVVGSRAIAGVFDCVRELAALAATNL